MSAYDTILLIATVLLLPFALVIPFGAPYLPSLRPTVKTAFDMLGLKKGQTLLELGSGDGRVLRQAAERGYKAVGIELNPFLVLYSRIRLFRYRKQVKVIWGSFWAKPWPPADGIFCFILQPHMEKINQKVIASYPKGIKLVSFTYTIDSRKPSQEKNALFLYKY